MTTTIKVLVELGPNETPPTEAKTVDELHKAFIYLAGLGPEEVAAMLTDAFREHRKRRANHAHGTERRHA